MDRYVLIAYFSRAGMNYVGGAIAHPLCTHEGSGMGRSEKDIATLCPQAQILRGLALRGGQVSRSKPSIEAWLRDAKLIP